MSLLARGAKMYTMGIRGRQRELVPTRGVERGGDSRAFLNVYYTHDAYLMTDDTCIACNAGGGLDSPGLARLLPLVPVSPSSKS